MRIYTSFFDNWKSLKPHHIVIVAVTERRPVGFSDMPILASLAPNEACKLADLDRQIKTYWKEVLAKCDPKSVYSLLRVISMRNNNADIALCEFSRPSEYNYRRQIALWLEKNLAIKVTEYPVLINPDNAKIEEHETKEELYQKEMKRELTLGQKCGMDNPFPRSNWLPTGLLDNSKNK